MTRTASTLVVTIGAVLIATAAAAQAPIKPTAPIFVIDLIAEPVTTTVVSARSFNEALKDQIDQQIQMPALPAAGAAAGAGVASPIERVMTACTATGTESQTLTTADRERRRQMVRNLQKCTTCLKAHQETRYITDRGDTVALIVIFDANAVSDEDVVPTFHENPRDSELVATLKATAKLLRDTTPEDKAYDCRAFPYPLVHTRSTFKVTLEDPRSGGSARAPAAGAPDPLRTGAAPPAAPPDPLMTGAARPAAPPAGPQATSKAVEISTPETILGPAEHWFVSIDFSMPVTAVKLGTAPEADDDRLKAKAFFIALDFALGDLLVDRKSRVQGRSFLKEIVLKAQITPSTTPWEAWAVGVGVRGYRIRTLLWNFDAMHPYVTFGRQKDDVGVVRWRAVFGVGFDPRSLKR